jgi:ribosomal protein S18 acetylase RimI-like enzyme
MARFTIARAETPEDLQAVAVLFADYAAWLPIDLGYQGFEAELLALPGKYAPPRGELLLARGPDGAALGCVGLRAIDPDGVCEMKRLYIAPEARGMGLGRALATAIIEAARTAGYREMRLDTLEGMTPAITLYEQLGFARIGPYYAPTPPGTVFMGLSL